MSSRPLTLRHFVLALAASAAATAAFAAPASATTETFPFTGAAQAWVVPQGVTQATFDIRGSGSGAAGGGHATAIIPLRPGETVQVNVGGLPHGATGGFNGGGDSQISPGGGATDIRIGGTSLNDRALVAGGGGGGMSPPPMLGGPGAPGGGGGGLYGNSGGAVLDGAGGSGGTQTEGGSSFCGGPIGSLGAGGGGPMAQGGGGGGGFYGGGAGCLGGGGGGSGYGPIGTQFETGVSSGNGSATVEYEVAPVPNLQPEITGLKVRQRKLAELTLSKDANVIFRVRLDRRKGRMSQHSQISQKRDRRAPQDSRTFTRSLGQGPNSVPLSDALIKTLKPQRYTLEAVATDASKQRSDTAVARFRIPKP